MKSLVTGAGGAIGFHLVNFLVDQGHDVHVIDNFSRSERDSHYLKLISHPRVSEHVLDLKDRSQVASLPDDFEFVFHLAAMNGTSNFYERPLTVMENSTLPTLNLLRKFENSRALKRFVYAGSSEAYASTVATFGWEVPTGEDVPLSIDNPMNPRWSYAISKLHGEIACVAAATEFTLPFTIVRFHNVYGPRMGDKHVIPDFVKRAINGVYKLIGWEDTRTFIYVSDAVRSTVALAQSPKAANQIVNVGGELEISMKDLGEKILEIMDISATIELLPSPSGSVGRRAPKLEKFKEITGLSAEVSLEDGLKATIANITDPDSPF